MAGLAARLFEAKLITPEEGRVLSAVQCSPEGKERGQHACAADFPVLLSSASDTVAARFTKLLLAEVTRMNQMGKKWSNGGEALLSSALAIRHYRTSCIRDVPVTFEARRSCTIYGSGEALLASIMMQTKVTYQLPFEDPLAPWQKGYTANKKSATTNNTTKQQAMKPPTAKSNIKKAPGSVQKRSSFLAWKAQAVPKPKPNKDSRLSQRLKSLYLQP